MSEHVTPFGFAILAKENLALHFLRLGNARVGECRDAELNVLEHPIVNAARIEVSRCGDFLWPVDDERN